MGAESEGRIALFAGPQRLARIRAAVRDHPLIRDFFTRLMDEADRDLARGSEEPDGPIGGPGDTYGHRGHWYAESHAAHRLGARITRLALGHVLAGRSDLREACATAIDVAVTREIA